jgi:ubiquinone/menaquinone biosynthesis C-methylase UbiE
VGSRPYFDEVEHRKYFVEPHIPKFANFSAWKNKKVLEVGVGIGTDGVNFVRAGAIYTGIELSTNSLDIAKKRFEVFELSGDLREGDAQKVDTLFPSELFDLIYSFGVLHHTPSIESAFLAIRNLMSTESVFKFMVYSKNSYKQALINEGLDQPEAQFGCPIANSYTKFEISELLLQNGLEIVDVHKDHIFPYKIEEYKSYEYVKEDWFASMPDEIFKALEKNFGWHLMITAKLCGK